MGVQRSKLLFHHWLTFVEWGFKSQVQVYFWQRQGQPADGLVIPNDLTPRWVCWQLGLDQNFIKPHIQLSHFGQSISSCAYFDLLCSPFVPNGGYVPKWSDSPKEKSQVGDKALEASMLCISAEVNMAPWHHQQWGFKMIKHDLLVEIIGKTGVFSQMIGNKHMEEIGRMMIDTDTHLIHRFWWLHHPKNHSERHPWSMPERQGPPLRPLCCFGVPSTQGSTNAHYILITITHIHNIYIYMHSYMILIS